MKIQQIILLTITLLFNNLYLFADSKRYTYSSELDGIAQDGYYNVELSQDIVAVSDAYFSSLRLLNEDGKEVPYFIRSESPIQEVSKFKEIPILANTHKDSLTTLIIENKDEADLSQLYIVIANADVDKSVSVRGSNDQKQWYIVKKIENVTGSGFIRDQEEYLNIPIPAGNYLYYEITLSNSQKSPLKVLKAGNFENSNIYSQLTEVELGGIVQKDSTDKRTYLFFPTIGYDFKICKIEFDIEYNGGYKRRASLGDYGTMIELSSKGGNTFFIGNTTLSPMSSIVIENNDNPPLKIKSVKAYGLNRYLCAYLNENKKYKIVIDNDFGSPVYDLAKMQDEIPGNLKIVKAKHLSVTVITPEVKKIKWYERSEFLWSAMILVGMILTILCWKIIKEMKIKN